jgi:hypothetical protein
VLEFKIASLQVSRHMYRSARDDHLKNLTDEEASEESKKKDEVNDIESVELDKLAKSSCINLLNDNFQRHYYHSLTKATYNNIKSRCAQVKSLYTDSLDPVILQMINALFDDLKQFQFEQVYKMNH